MSFLMLHCNCLGSYFGETVRSCCFLVSRHANASKEKETPIRVQNGKKTIGMRWRISLVGLRKMAGIDVFRLGDLFSITDQVIFSKDLLSHLS